MDYLNFALVFATAVAGHGYVRNATIGEKDYTFYQPYQDPYLSPKPARISREIQGNRFVEDVTISDIQCGGYASGGINGSKPAALHAEVAAGSEVSLYWTLWPKNHIGPTITYMARCPNSGCNNWMPESSAVWFKVQEQGRQGTSDVWASAALSKPGTAAKYIIPQCIPSGYYLVRHEIIALHAADQYPGAQFYPSCHQLKVSSGGRMSPSDLVSFPGAYQPTDVGITYDAFKAQSYTILGPKKFTCSKARAIKPRTQSNVNIYFYDTS